MSTLPGLVPRIAYRFVWRPEQRMEPVAIDRTMADGDILPIGGGLKIIGTPGHCAGQVALLWQGGRLLIAGDVGMNIVGLAGPVGSEDEAAKPAKDRGAAVRSRGVRPRKSHLHRRVRAGQEEMGRPLRGCWLAACGR